MPYGIETGTSAVYCDAALFVADADDVYAMPADDGSAQSLEAAADAKAGAAAAAVPARGRSARVGSIQSDSPRVFALEPCDLRELAGVVGFSYPTSVLQHISAVTSTKVASRCGRTGTDR